MTGTTIHPSQGEYTPLPSVADLKDADKRKNEQRPAPAEVANPKYAGKTVEELMQMHAEAEKKLGSQGQEIGHLRSLTDQLLELKRNEDLSRNGGQVDEPEITGDDLLTDPAATIEKLVAKRVSSIEHKLLEQDIRAQEKAFEADFPSYQDDMQDPNFINWISSSNYRKRLVQAAQSGDFDAARELWGGYSEARTSVKSAPANDGGREQALRDAAMVSGAGGGSGPSKPIYSRHELINKRINDPTGYYDPYFQKLIQEAYREKRVR